MSEVLEQFRAKICNCTECKLSVTRKKFVFGEGNSKADIMFIGEAPGADEDAQGRPFVGRAGRLLTNIIIAMGLQRKDVYIANVVKCRPPDNRDPTYTEIITCRPYLDRQIEIVNPRCLCLLGRVATYAILGGTSSIKSMRQQILTYNGIDTVVTYHPAALLRQAKFKPAVWEDMRFLRKHCHGVELKE